ncbi:MAG: nucleotidyltransferase domain-containing protein [Planctomycetota bacterium]
MVSNIQYEQDDLTRCCQKHRIVRLSLFGSVLRDDFDPRSSDVDVLVEFEAEAEASMTYFRLGGIVAELQDLLGRSVDLSLANSLDRGMRDDILSSAEVQYVAK